MMLIYLKKYPDFKYSHVYHLFRCNSLKYEKGKSISLRQGGH